MKKIIQNNCNCLHIWLLFSSYIYMYKNKKNVQIFNNIVYTSFCFFLTNSTVCGACCQAFVNRLYQFAFHLGQQWAVHTNTPQHLKKKVKDHICRIKCYILYCGIYIYPHHCHISIIIIYLCLFYVYIFDENFICFIVSVKHCYAKVLFKLQQ